MKFHEIIHALSPEVVGERVARRILEAQRSFQADFRVTSYHALVEIVSDYYEHLNNHFLQVNVETPPEYSFGQVLHLLRVDSLEPFYDKAIRGIDRGVFEVLDLITKRFLDDAVQRYISFTLENAADPLNFEEIDSLMTEYVATFGKFLGFALRPKGLLVMRWKEILGQHAQVLAQIRSQVGSF